MRFTNGPNLLRRTGMLMVMLTLAVLAFSTPAWASGPGEDNYPTLGALSSAAPESGAPKLTTPDVVVLAVTVQDRDGLTVYSYSVNFESVQNPAVPNSAPDPWRGVNVDFLGSGGSEGSRYLREPSARGDSGIFLVNGGRARSGGSETENAGGDGGLARCPGGSAGERVQDGAVRTGG